MTQFYKNSDTLVLCSSLQDQTDDNYITNATVTCTLYEYTTRKTLDKGPAVDKGGGLVGLPCSAHGRSSGDYVLIGSSINYDAEYQLDATTSANELVVTASYVAETFNGRETVQKAVTNARNISLSYIAASDGNYRGTIPDTVKLIEEDEYDLITTATDSNSNVLNDRKRWKVGYHDN